MEADQGPLFTRRCFQGVLKFFPFIFPLVTSLIRCFHFIFLPNLFKDYMVSVMAGHSKWKNIQHRKGAQDAKKGKVFTKIIKEITVAIKERGGDPENNSRLRLAMQNARGANMPKDNVDRAIQKASGVGGEFYTEVTFEGYGPWGGGTFYRVHDRQQY